MRIQWIVVCVGLLASLGLVGCGGDGMAEVSGTVQYEGKPVEKGSIGVAPIDGKGPTAGGEIKDAKYKFRAPIGKLKVEIRYPKASGKKKDYDAPGGKWYETFSESLPPKFNDKTELTLDVNPGENKKDWDLKK